MDNLRSFTTHNNSRSLLFLTELILAILIFALSMGICGSIFVKAFEATTASSNLSNAVFLAENAAETFHLEDDPHVIADRLGGVLSVSGGIVVRYDRQWQPTESENAPYVLSITIAEEGRIKKAEISITGGSGEIYSLLSTKNTAFSGVSVHD